LFLDGFGKPHLTTFLFSLATAFLTGVSVYIADFPVFLHFALRSLGAAAGNGLTSSGEMMGLSLVLLPATGIVQLPATRFVLLPASGVVLLPAMGFVLLPAAGFLVRPQAEQCQEQSMAWDDH